MRNPRTGLITALVSMLLLAAACDAGTEVEGTAETVPEPTAATTPAEPTDVATATPTDEPTDGATATPTDEPTDGATATATEEAAGEDVLATLEEQGDFSMLLQAVRAAGLEDAIEQAGPVTIFAPTDEAFQNIDQDMLTSLLQDPEQVRDILEAHIVPGEAVTTDMIGEGEEALETLSGEEVTITVNGEEVTVEGASVIETLEASGGSVIHTVDEVLMP